MIKKIKLWTEYKVFRYGEYKRKMEIEKIIKIKVEDKTLKKYKKES